MNVKLISLTQPMMGKEMSAEELIVYIARVSNPSNQDNLETAPKLISYLIKKKHWSPFDMVNMTVEVVTSRMIAQQILRHWSIKPQEFSQRYAEVIEIEPIELRRQAEKNRQSSEEVINPKISFYNPIKKYTEQREANDLVAECVEYCREVYRSLLTGSVSKETARQILPLATQTTLYLNGSIRSWIHYIEQRCDLHAQKEHRLVAIEIKKIFDSFFPNISTAIENAGQ